MHTANRVLLSFGESGGPTGSPLAAAATSLSDVRRFSYSYSPPPTLHSDIVSTRHFVLLEPFASRLVSVPPLLFSLLLQAVGTTILCPSSLPLFIFSFSFSSPFLLLPHLSIFFSFSFTSVAACASSTQDALVIKRFFFLRWFKSFINWLA